MYKAMKIFSLFSRKQEGNEQLIPEVAENAQVQENDEDSQNENAIIEPSGA